MLVVLMVTEMMTLMMAMAMSMGIRMLDCPICEHVLNMLDMTIPKPSLRRIPNQLFCCRTQWQVTRPRLRSEREETHRLA